MSALSTFINGIQNSIDIGAEVTYLVDNVNNRIVEIGGDESIPGSLLELFDFDGLLTEILTKSFLDFNPVFGPAPPVPDDGGGAGPDRSAAVAENSSRWTRGLPNNGIGSSPSLS